MRKLVVLTAIPLLFSTVFTSIINAKEIKVIGGINLSYYSVYPKVFNGIDWEDGIEYQYKSFQKSGTLVGFGIEYFLTRNKSIEIDLLYFQKGSDLTLLRQNIPHIKMNYVLDVISLPILLKARLLPETSPYILGGIELSYILSHHYKWSYDEGYLLPERVTYDEDIKDSTKNYDIGIVVGVGFEIKIKLISLFIEIRYHQGTINITPKNYRPDSMKTRSEVILFGLKI